MPSGSFLRYHVPRGTSMGRPFLHARVWLVEVLPLEVPEVLRIRRRAVEGPALPFDIGGQLPAEVLMDFAEGPIAEHKPHNMVGGGPSDDARVGEEHHVRLGLAVDVEGHEDLAPEERCRPTKAPLDDVPIVGEALLDELEVQPLEVLECWSIAMVQPPEGREVLMEGLPVPHLRQRVRVLHASRGRRILRSEPPRLLDRGWRRRRSLICHGADGIGLRTSRNTDGRC